MFAHDHLPRTPPRRESIPQECTPVWPTAAGAAFAAASPLLLTYAPGPQTAFFKDALGLIGWGVLFVLVGHRLAGGPRTGAGPGAFALLVAIALMIVAAAAGVLLTGALPGMAASDTLALAAAAAAVLTGNRVGRLAELGAHAPARVHAEAAIIGFWSGLAIAALLNAAVAVAQVYAPAVMAAVGFGVAGAPLSGRGIGLVRQSNVLATLMVWGAGALVVLAERGRLRPAYLLAGGAALMTGAVVSGSRMGVACVMLLGVWALADRRLTTPIRKSLATFPLLYLLAWAGGLWLTTRLIDTGSVAKDVGVVRSDLGSPRWALWRQTVDLISDQPWIGVGWGNFNFAWTLTPMERPTAHHFTHAHNAVLQWAVELGVPLTLVLLGLIAFAGWRAATGLARPQSPTHAVRSVALLMLAAAGVHSLTEYPLWFAHLLLPVAFCFGLALAGERSGSRVASRRRRGAGGRPANAGAHGYAQRATGAPPLLAICGWAVVAGTLLGVRAYMPTLELMYPGDPLATIDDRVDAASRSWLFPEWGQRFRATLANSGERSLEPFDRGAARRLLDDRLLLAWALAYHEMGDDDRAWYLAQRMGEFRTPAARRLFAHCGAGTVATAASSAGLDLQEIAFAPPAGHSSLAGLITVPPNPLDAKANTSNAARDPPTFQCGARAVDLTWRDFVRLRDVAND